MYKSKEEAIEALAGVRSEIEAILDGGVWVDGENERFLAEIEAVTKEMEEMQSELCGAIIQLTASSSQCLGQHRRNYVALTVVEAKELISKFNIVEAGITT